MASNTFRADSSGFRSTTASTISTASSSDASEDESVHGTRQRTVRQGLMMCGSDAAAPAPRPTCGAAKFCKAFQQAQDVLAAGGEERSAYHTLPDSVLEGPSVPYRTLPWKGGACRPDLAALLAETPLPKGSAAFSSVHVVACQGAAAQAALLGLQSSAEATGKEPRVHAWPALEPGSFEGEYAALFRVASDLVLQGADRSSLVVFLAGEGGESEMAAAALLGMLPFRGVQVAFVSPSWDYVDPLRTLRTASGLFEYTATQPERMGRRPLAAIFGPLPPRNFRRELAQWCPLKPPAAPYEKPAPFKIGGLELPMVTFEGQYNAGVKRLAQLLAAHFGPSMFPVVSVGRTVDALGYGADVLAALRQCGCPGHYFAHDSGESFKKPEAFGKAELLTAVAVAKAQGRRPVVIAVGGGVNGNAMGTVAAMIGANFVEVPTTLMHYNDATTSAKKAFSLVADGKILAKNILGTFYLPQLVFCISETFLTLDSCSIHAAVGEATKTMSMLGNARSVTGQRDFHNILGAVEFASDFTRMVGTVEGFERLILFLRSTLELKAQALEAGHALRAACGAGASAAELEGHAERRRQTLARLRAQFHEGLPPAGCAEIMAFLTTINEEVIRAKAMFLAYSDPFEKYRALLFEYAHTLGHGVEAFMNGLYGRAEAAGIEVGEAFRLHGQCVGMAVLWAGEMSRRMGHLDGAGYLAHQALVYLFNRFGGFDFAPLRRLCDALGVSCGEFCEGVLQVVRRDNKRGYCKCAPGSSVDQLVCTRPGRLVHSADPSAELRYLVEVSEEAQREVLEEAFEGAYDQVLVSGVRGPDSWSHGLELLPRVDFAEKFATPDEQDSRAGPAAVALDALLRSVCIDEGVVQGPRL